jgi:hypothetical protein
MLAAGRVLGAATAKTFLDLSDGGIFARPAHGASSVIRGVKVLDSGGNSGGVTVMLGLWKLTDRQPGRDAEISSHIPIIANKTNFFGWNSDRCRLDGL